MNTIRHRLLILEIHQIVQITTVWLRTFVGDACYHAARSAEQGRRKNSKIQRNIFVIGLEDFNLRLLQKVRHSEQYHFHPLLGYQSVTQLGREDAETLLARARAKLDGFSGEIHAIVGYWDFPTNLMLPILRERYGLVGPRLESVLRCEHKYWARLLQKETVPDLIPEFALVDPFTEKAADNPPLDFPFWIKPVKAHSSKLGVWVENRYDCAAFESWSAIRGKDFFAAGGDSVHPGLVSLCRSAARRA